MTSLRRRAQGVSFVAVLGTLLALAIGAYAGVFRDGVPVTLRVERAGSQLNERADVKIRGLVVGERIVLLAACLALAVALAVGFALLDHSARADPAAANTALTDVGTTAEVAGQLGSALETIYSYDYTRLDENERAAREVITPAFGAKFAELFADVRELAPAQQAVVSGTVVVSAVQRIEGERAVLVAFMDQQATRVAAPDGSGQLAASSRLTVTAERVDGRWKIADVQSR
jgi:Mce-associated membrane protein